MTNEVHELHSLLYQLNITANYRGFFYTSYAAQLAIQQPERLIYVTKWLYPEVARRYGTNWHCVERNIRTVAQIAWSSNRHLLEHITQQSLPSRPSASLFIAALVRALSEDHAA